MREWATKRANQLVARPLLLAGVGWLAALVFLTFWLFDVGRGSLVVGTLGEWVSGLAVTGAVIISLYVLIHDRRERRASEEVQKWISERSKRVRRFTTQMELTKEAEVKVPIHGSWYRKAGETGDGDGHYRVELEVYNGLDRPVREFTANLRLTADWSRDDYDTRLWPGGVSLCSNRTIPPGDTYKFEMEEDTFYTLPVERVDAGAYLVATWRIGDNEYNWIRFSGNEKGILNVSESNRP